MHNTYDSDSFYCQGHYIIKWHFQHVCNAFKNDYDDDDDDDDDDGKLFLWYGWPTKGA